MLGLAALAVLMAGCLLVLLPFVTALLWAVILTFSTWPIYAGLKRSVGGRPTVAAALMTMAVSLVMLAPFVIVVLGLADNAAELVDALRRVFENGLPDAPAWVRDLPIIGDRVEAYWRALVHDENRLLDELRTMLVATRAFLLTGGGYLAAGVMQLALSVLVAFFLFRDGEAAAGSITAHGCRSCIFIPMRKYRSFRSPCSRRWMPRTTCA
jgi:predicted PurR-regulated permease PerM